MIVSRFVAEGPLAVAFPLPIGVALTAGGLRFHIPRGYICGALAFRIEELSR